MRHPVLTGIACATSSSSARPTTFPFPAYRHIILSGNNINEDPIGSSSSSHTARRRERIVVMGSSSSAGSTAASSPRGRLPPPSAEILSKIEKFARGGDALFGFVERCHVDRGHAARAADGEGDDDDARRCCLGDVLDAGTGSHSLRWMASVMHRDSLLESLGDDCGATTTTTATTAAAAAPRVSMRSYTAVTADDAMRKRVYEEARELGVEGMGDVVIGNWNDDSLLTGRMYDTILADYLVGAIDGFSPYFQDLALSRLCRHLKSGGRMYVIGLQPVPDAVVGDGDVFCRITKVRDACILLAGHRCYREYPVDWIERHMMNAGLDVVTTRTYPIRYDHPTMVRQINVGRSKLKFFPSKGMAKEMGLVLDGLEKESLEVTRRQKDGRITLGFDYVVVAEKSNKEEGTK